MQPTPQLEADYASPIIAADEPPPYTLCNPDGAAPLVIVCDHASSRVPRSLDNLGVEADALTRHIACDIGSAALSRQLAERLDAPCVLANYSRLVIDLNRFPEDPTSIIKISDGVPVPGNHDIGPEQAAQRGEELFAPYHRAVAAELDRILRRGQRPALLCVHSFTPVFAGQRRPWHIGVLWNEDGRLAQPMLAALRRRDDLCVGDNQPYHALDPRGYTVTTHAESQGFAHLLLEVRQDLIADTDAVSRWTELLHHDLAAVLAEAGISPAA